MRGIVCDMVVTRRGAAEPLERIDEKMETETHERSIKAISRHIGHAQTSLTLDVYAHVLPEQYTEMADTVAVILFRNAPVGEQ